MEPVAAIEIGRVLDVIVGGSIVVWILLAGFTAEYGRQKGFPWFPLFVCSLFLGWPLVLLASAIGAGPRSRT